MGGYQPLTTREIERAMDPKPQKGEGERFLDCPHYEGCLDYAAVPNWKSFNCESCPFYELYKKGTPAGQETETGKKLCETCHERPVIHPNSPYCSICMNKKRWENSKARKKAPAKPKKKKTTPCKPQAEKPQQDRKTALTIEFGRHAPVLREVEKLAEEEMRPVDLQVIYILKQYLNSGKA